MMKKILLASFIILTVLGFQNRAAAQCTGTPIVSFVLTGTTNVSCFNGNDGSITTTLTGGQAPFTYSLVYATGGGDIPISQISNTNSQVAVFTGLFANDFLASFLGPGNYRVDVITTNGTMGIPPLGFCNARQVPNIILTQPTELQLTGSDVALTCFNDNNGSGVITASGGTAPYTFAPVDNGTGATIGTTATTVTFSGASAGSIEVTVTDDNGCQDVITINVTEPPQLVINSVNVTNETCTTGNDGQITVNASGGSGALTYTLNPGGVVNNTGVFSGLSAGIYTVDVDDAAGCGPVASGNINVILPDVEIAIDSNTPNTRCLNPFNGAISITPSGGTAPYSYAWTGPNGFNSALEDLTGLEPGAYTLTLTDPVSGCTDVEVINVADNPPTVSITVDGVTDNTRCIPAYNGAINVTVSGATQFAWTGPNGFTASTADIASLEPGAYTLTATDPVSGCNDVQIVNVGDNPPTVSITVDGVLDNTRCIPAYNGAINVTVAGATQFAWTGPNGFTASTADIAALEPGAYTLTATDAVSGCNDVQIVNVGDNPPTVSITVDGVTDNTRCIPAYNGAINVTVSGATQFAWTGPNGFTAATADIAALEPGAYTLTATDPVSGCNDIQIVNVGDNPPTVSITVDGVTDNTRCIPAYNGAINVTVTGATQFAWTGPNGFTAATADISALEPGAYTLTATDPVSGCNAVQIVNVGDNPPAVSITVDGVTDNTRCIPAYDGAINVTVSGATQFAWTGPNGFTAATADISALEPGAYTLTATDPVSGCNDVQIVNVGDNPPTVSITVDGVTDNTRCIPAYNGAINVTVSGATQFAWTGPNGFSAATADISALEPGAYTLTATDPVSGCEAIENVNVGDNPPNVSITVDGVTDNTRCIPAYNGAINVTVSGATQFAWTGPNGFSAATADIVALEPGAYTLTATDPVSGCTDVQIVNVGDNPPTVSITVDGVTDNTRCIPAYNGAINVTVSGATQFAWTGPNGFTAATADVSALEPGAYTLTATDPVSGCEAIENVNVGDNPPTVSITVDGVTDNTRCIPAYNGAINVTVSGATQFAWTGPNGFTASTADISALEPGAYTLTATDPVSGCEAIENVNIGDNPPTVSITVDGVTDNTRCIPAYNGAINVTVSGATQFAWTGPNGFSAATADIVALEPGAYTLTATDPVSGCTDVQIVNVGDNPPTVSITVDGVTDNTRCIPAYNGAINVTVSGATQFAWTGPNGFTASTADIAALEPGAYTLTATDPVSGCEAIENVNVGDNPPTVSIMVDGVTDNTRCIPAYNGAINVTVSGATQFAWTGPNGFTASTADIGALEPGSYTLTATDPVSGCEAIENINVGDNSPTVSIIVDGVTNNTRCIPTFNGAINVTVSGATQFAWTGPNGFTAAIADIADLEPGAYTLTATDPVSGCEAVQNVNVADNSPTVSITVDAVTDNNKCTVPYAGAINVTIAGGTQISWTGPNGFTSSDEDLIELESGAYTLTLTDPISGCEAVEVVNVDDTTPAVSITVDDVTDNSVCVAPFTGAISVTISGGSQISWTGPNGFTSSDEDLTALETGSYTLTLTDPVSGCEAVEVVNVGSTSPTVSITVDATTDNTRCVGPFAGSIDVTVSGATQFSWTGPNGFTSNNEDISALEHGAYTLTATDPVSGCTDLEVVNVGDNRPTVTINVDATGDNNRCVAPFNGSIDVTVTVATQFAWTGPNGFAANTEDIAALEDGAYTLTATDPVSGCSEVVVVNVGNTRPTITITTDSDDASCFGVNNGEIRVLSVVGGTGPYDYSINGGSTFQALSTFSGLSSGLYQVVARDIPTGCISNPTPITINALTAIIPTIEKTDAACNGVSNGMIRVAGVTGGTGPYQYSVDNGVSFQLSNEFNGLQGGVNYSVVVMDASLCRSSAFSIVINNTQTITATASKTDTSCDQDDGVITVNVTSGGVAPFSYSLNGGAFQLNDNTFENLAPATYSVVVRDNGSCLSNVVLVSVGVVSNIVPVIEKTDATCAPFTTGEIRITSVTGGVGGYEYSINNGAPGSFQASPIFPNLSGDTNYSVVVRDSEGCRSSAVSIIINNQVTFGGSIVKTDASSCADDGRIEIAGEFGTTTPFGYSITGGAPFQASPVFTGLAPGTYQVVMENNMGCTKVLGTTVIGVTPGNIIPTIAKQDADCNGVPNGSITISAVTGGTTPYEYSKDNGVTFQFPNQFDNLAAGTYSIVVRDASSCVSSVATITILNGVTINASANPTNVSCAGGDGEILVGGVTGGTLPYEYSLNGGAFQTDPEFDNLAQGVYSIVVRDAGGCLSAPITAAVSSNCNGGGGPGGGTCSAIVQVVAEQRPSCTDQDDGSITLTVVPTGTPDPSYTLILYDSVSTPIFKREVSVLPNTPHVFSDLSPSNFYHYQVNTCQGLAYSLPLLTTVQATVDLASVTNPTCFGSATGSAVINATGSTTGEYYYSLDGSSWKLFVPGTPGQIADLPPIGTQQILVGEKLADACPASVEVTINSVNPDINATFSITAATCDGADGAITNIIATGGSGSGYQFSIDGINYKADNNFTALTGGFYSIRVRDGSGCEKIVPANVTFPGFINFSYTAIDPTCANNGNSGSLVVKVLDPGTYELAISEDQFNEPADSEYRNYSDPFITFNNLSRGTYFVYAKSTTAVCPTRSEPIAMQGAYALSFEVQPTCVANDLSVTLTNITGEPGVAFEFRVYKKTTGVLVETIQRTSISATATEFLEYQLHTFLRNADDYQIQMVQTSPSTGCEIVSPLVDVVVPNEVFALVGPSKQSYPDIANGSIEANNISGGAMPYSVRIELDSAASFNFQSYETNFTEPDLNANNQFQKKFENVPPGRYVIQVMDNVGCVLELVGRVKMDQTVYIPNIFTPNGDNVNDLFFIRNLPADNAQLVVSSRWGKEVYSSKNYTNDWNGEGAADGVYFYQLSVGGSEPITGWVEIIRGEKP